MNEGACCELRGTRARGRTRARRREKQRWLDSPLKAVPFASLRPARTPKPFGSYRPKRRGLQTKTSRCFCLCVNVVLIPPFDALPLTMHRHQKHWSSEVFVSIIFAVADATGSVAAGGTDSRSRRNSAARSPEIQLNRPEAREIRRPDLVESEHELHESRTQACLRLNYSVSCSYANRSLHA